MHKNIEAVILDWAGTTIDFGCFAPVEAFMSAFHQFSIFPTMEQVRAPMGLPKRDHIQAMLFSKDLSNQFYKKFGHIPDQEDVEKIYQCFEPCLMSALENFGVLLPDVKETVSYLKEKGIKIGSTTGYTKQMMQILAPVVKQNGYEPDCLVCPEEVGGKGRPFPFMIWKNLEKLNVCDIHNTLKIGDTAADMAEGKHAGCMTIGVIMGSNMLGLSQLEYRSLEESTRCDLHEKAKAGFFAAGADYVIERLSALPQLLEQLESEDF